jgi:hypothetical protein
MGQPVAFILPILLILPIWVLFYLLGFAAWSICIISQG